MTADQHECARCGGEGYVIIAQCPSCRTDVDRECDCCGAHGICTGPLDPGTGDCTRCGWSYSGPDDIDHNAPGPGERAEMADLARRMK